MSTTWNPNGLVRYEAFVAEGSTNRLIIHLPGVLAYGTATLLPLDDSPNGGVLGAMRRHGDVITASYTGRNFDPVAIAQDLGQLLGSDMMSNYAKLGLVGSSVGALLTVDALAQIKPQALLPAVRFIPVDPPFGSADLVGGGKWLAPFVRRTGLANLDLLHGIRVKGTPPKPEGVQPGLPFHKVNAAALHRMDGFDVGRLLQQLAYIDTWGARRHPIPPDALYYMRDTHYVQCMLHNTTVRARAARKWTEWGSLWTAVHLIGSSHCGYLEQEDRWVRLFNQLLSW